MNRVKMFREARKLTQQELAKAAKVGARTISRYEADPPDMYSYIVLKKLARALGVSVGHLLED